MTRRISSSYHYIRLSITPPCADVFTARKTMQDALDQAFGLVSSHTYLDILWFADGGDALVLRIGKRHEVMSPHMR